MVGRALGGMLGSCVGRVVGITLGRSVGARVGAVLGRFDGVCSTINVYVGASLIPRTAHIMGWSL